MNIDRSHLARNSMPQTGRPQFCILTRPGLRSCCGASYTGMQVCVFVKGRGGGEEGTVSSLMLGVERWEEGSSKEELEGEVSTIMKEDKSSDHFTVHGSSGRHPLFPNSEVPQCLCSHQNGNFVPMFPVPMFPTMQLPLCSPVPLILVPQFPSAAFPQCAP